MGMHFGIIAARIPLQLLIQLLNEQVVALESVRQLQRLEEGDKEVPSREYIIAGEYKGAAYIFDPSLLLLACPADLIAEIAEHTKNVVVSCGAETVSGSFWFNAFSGSKIMRLFWMCRMTLTAPYSKGERFESEATHPLDMDWDGDGIFAALREMGFEYQEWMVVGPYQLFKIGELCDWQKGILQGDINEHCQRHEIPRDRQPKIKVVRRDLPSGGLWSRIVARLFKRK